MNRMTSSLLLSFNFILITAAATLLPGQAPQQVILPIAPVPQQTGTWCWLATGQMIFQYYGVPANHPTDFQCGEARGQGAVPTGGLGQYAFAGPCWNNCYACGGVGAGTIVGLYNLIIQYPQIVARTVGNTKLLQAQFAVSPLSFPALEVEINAGRPIAAGISPGAGFLPPGVSEHAVLIVGYDISTNSVFINDPFPYQSQGMQPSYLQFGGIQTQPGQFQVPYATLVGPIKWGNTVFGIR
jgi:hypothetical protein